MIGIKYVLGFIINPYLDQILLIEKQKEDWQKGQLNGLGGHIEKDEDSLDAMVRESFEETKGLKFYRNTWDPVCVMFEECKWHCRVYKTIGNYDLTGLDGKTLDGVKTKEGILRIKSLKNIYTNKQCISNLKWLIAMCMDDDKFFGTIQYRP